MHSQMLALTLKDCPVPAGTASRPGGFELVPQCQWPAGIPVSEPGVVSGLGLGFQAGHGGEGLLTGATETELTDCFRKCFL